MKNSPRIVLKYSCNQNWVNMKPTKDGRFCDFCGKNIIDFSNHSIQEIQNYSKDKENLCGAFALEQLEPELVSAEKIISPLKKYLLVILSFINYEISGSNIVLTEKHKTEQSILPDTNDKKNTKKTIPKPITSEEKKYSEYNDCPPESHSTSKSHRLYFSKRFPFIHFRKKRRIYPGYF
jgi:hypothetical protein